MLHSVGITDPLDPLTQEQLQDPTGKHLCLILYLHSIEPAFYAHLNDAIHSLDQSKLSKLGPFAAALQAI